MSQSLKIQGIWHIRGSAALARGWKARSGIRNSQEVLLVVRIDTKSLTCPSLPAPCSISPKAGKSSGNHTMNSFHPESWAASLEFVHSHYSFPNLERRHAIYPILPAQCKISNYPSVRNIQIARLPAVATAAKPNFPLLLPSM